MDYFCLESRVSTLIADLEEYSKKCIVDKQKSKEFKEIEGDLMVKLNQILSELEEEEDQEDEMDYSALDDHRYIDKSCKHTFNIPQFAFKKDKDMESRELQTFKQVATLRFGNGTITVKAETKYKPIDNSVKPHRYLKITVKAENLKNVAGFMQLYNKKLSDSIVEPFEIPMDESKFHWSIKYKDLMKTDLGHLAKNKEIYYLIAVCFNQYSQIDENIRSTQRARSVEIIKRNLEILEKRCQPYKQSLEFMKKFQKAAPSSENDNANNSSYETADIRLRNKSQNQQPIFAVGRLQNNKKNRIELKEFVKSEFEDMDVGPSRFSWHKSNSKIPAMDAIRTKIKLLEYKIIQNFKTPSLPGDSPENVDFNANIQMQHNCHLMNDLQIESDEF